MKSLCSLPYCLSKLSAAEYVVYLACCELWLGKEMELYAQNVADLICIQARTVRGHLPALQRKGFITYNSSKQRGTVMLWVRITEREQQPDAIAHYGSTIVLKSPDGKLHSIPYGKRKAFFEKYGLDRRHIYRVAAGQKTHHHGWTVVRAG